MVGRRRAFSVRRVTRRASLSGGVRGLLVVGGGAQARPAPRVADRALLAELAVGGVKVRPDRAGIDQRVAVSVLLILERPELRVLLKPINRVFESLMTDPRLL